MVLTSLADGPKHGYAVIKDLEQSAGVTLGAGTLYAVLSRLEERGWIEPLAAEERRRPYRLTGPGAVALETETRRIHQFAELGLRRLAAIPRPA
ncbi:MAG TPA: helix-turn-helix transcriptional regulator [Solirubrobacteraceae bacterium]|nr:helix-turn-helix transcriptional regulator [Solirubrobacteraceae bacterium]